MSHTAPHTRNSPHTGINLSFGWENFRQEKKTSSRKNHEKRVLLWPRQYTTWLDLNMTDNQFSYLPASIYLHCWKPFFHKLPFPVTVLQRFCFLQFPLLTLSFSFSFPYPFIPFILCRWWLLRFSFLFLKYFFPFCHLTACPCLLKVLLEFYIDCQFRLPSFSWLFTYDLRCTCSYALLLVSYILLLHSRLILNLGLFCSALFCSVLFCSVLFYSFVQGVHEAPGPRTRRENGQPGSWGAMYPL